MALQIGKFLGKRCIVISSQRRNAKGIGRAPRPLPGAYDEERTARYALQHCEHQLQMLSDTINAGSQRLISSADLRRYSKLCHDCSVKKARDAVRGDKP